MTNKKNLLLLVFMAVFLFSCATEDPTTDFTDRLEPARPISPGNEVAFKDALEDLRENSFSWASSSATPVGSARELEKSYLVTQLGDRDSGPWLVLYINNTVSGNADINMGFDANANQVGLTAALTQAENTAEYFDPRKLLFKDSDDDMRMGWAGRAGTTISSSSLGGTTVKAVTAYDGLRTVIHTETGSARSFGVTTTYVTQRYDQLFYMKNGRSVSIFSQRLMKMDNVGSIATTVLNDGTKSWGWSLRDFALQRSGAFVSDKDKTTYGNGNEDSFIYGSFDQTGYRNTLATVTELQGNDAVNDKNNFNPVGKLVMGRRGDKYIGDSTVLFFVPVVGYNLRTDAVSSSVAASLTGEGITSVRSFYMEFDNTTVADAGADGFTDAINFPFWGSIDAADGASVDRSGTQVKKFTGFLLKTE